MITIHNQIGEAVNLIENNSDKRPVFIVLNLLKAIIVSMFNLLPGTMALYTLNPAKVELMYFPTFFGRNEIKKVKVK